MFFQFSNLKVINSITFYITSLKSTLIRDAVRGSTIRECKKLQYWIKTVEHGLLHHLRVSYIALSASLNEPSACIVELRTVLIQQRG